MLSFQTKSSYNPIQVANDSSRSEAAVVLPSSWAKYDVKSLHVLREIVCTSNCRCREVFGSDDIRVDSTNHVKHRASRSILHHSLWINKDGSPFPARVGMKVRIHSTASLHEINTFNNSSQVKIDVTVHRREQCTCFDCDILSTFHVRHQADRGLIISAGHPIESSAQNSDNFISFYDSVVELLLSFCTSNYDSNDDEDGDNSEVEETRRSKRQRLNDANQESMEGRTILRNGDHVTLVRLDC